MKLRCINNEIEGVCRYSHFKLGEWYEFKTNIISLNRIIRTEYFLKCPTNVLKYRDGIFFTDYDGSISKFYIWHFFMSLQEFREVKIDSLFG